MTERPSQNKQILSKLDDLTETVSDIKQDIAMIKTQIEYQPKIDLEQHKQIEAQLDLHTKEINTLKDTNTWIVRSVFGQIFIIIGLIVYFAIMN